MFRDQPPRHLVIVSCIELIFDTCSRGIKKCHSRELKWLYLIFASYLRYLIFIPALIDNVCDGWLIYFLLFLFSKKFHKEYLKKLFRRYRGKVFVKKKPKNIFSYKSTLQYSELATEWHLFTTPGTLFDVTIIQITPFCRAYISSVYEQTRPFKSYGL